MRTLKKPPTPLAPGLDFQPLPSGFFRCAVFDYPHKFVAGTKGRPQHYQRMTHREICASNPTRIIHPDGGWLALWATGPQVENMFDWVDHWRVQSGRRIKFSTRGLGWAKLRDSHPGLDVAPAFESDFVNGQGLVSLKNLEDLWLFKVDDARLRQRGVKELIVSPRREHSRKPDESFDRLRIMLPGPYAEVFSRQPRAGWWVWGDQDTLFSEEIKDHAGRRRLQP